MEKEITHSFDIVASARQVWEFLWDVEAMAHCVPGCEETSVVEEGRIYKAKVRRKVGPFYIRFELDIEVVESVLEQKTVVKISGRDKRLRSEIKQTITTTLKENNDRSTSVSINTVFHLSGVLASLGWSLLQGHIYQTLDETVDAIRESLHQRTAGESSAKELDSRTVDM
jgi:carbon monoxide dehydrogenase subunit G